MTAWSTRTAGVGMVNWDVVNERVGQKISLTFRIKGFCSGVYMINSDVGEKMIDYLVMQAINFAWIGYGEFLDKNGGCK